MCILPIRVYLLFLYLTYPNLPSYSLCYACVLCKWGLGITDYLHEKKEHNKLIPMIFNCLQNLLMWWQICTRNESCLNTVKIDTSSLENFHWLVYENQSTLIRKQWQWNKLRHQMTPFRTRSATTSRKATKRKRFRILATILSS